MLPTMKPPELPRAILPSKTLDNRVSPGVLVKETCGVEDDVVYHDPDAVEFLEGGGDDGGGDKGEIGVY